jgi:hypothetical protein
MADIRCDIKALSAQFYGFHQLAVPAAVRLPYFPGRFPLTPMPVPRLPPTETSDDS